MKRKEKKVKIPRWNSQEPPYEVGKDGFEYKNTICDFDGWVDAERYRPYPYDLVLLKPQSKAKPGWWNGAQWEGYRLKEEEKVYYWKQEEKQKNAVKGR